MASRRHFLAVSAAGVGAAVLGTLPYRADAQALQQTVRMVVGFPPGGSIDAMARLLADRLSGDYAPTVIVENRAGAGGRIAAGVVKEAEPNGTIITLMPVSLLVIYPHVFKDLAYDPLTDLSPVASAGSVQFALSVGKAVPESVKTVADFGEWCKANPDKATFGSAGSGNMAHFAGAMIADALGAKLTHVPYKGEAPAIQDVIGGQIAAGVNVLSAPLPFALEGRLRILATTGDKRTESLPDVPTMVESGYPDVNVQEHFVVMMPGKTSLEARQTLAESLGRAVKTPQVQEGFSKQVVQHVDSSPQVLAELLKTELPKWGSIVKATGFTIEG